MNNFIKISFKADEIKKINDSMEQRENRIKSLKEVGKNLGG